MGCAARRRGALSTERADWSPALADRRLFRRGQGSARRLTRTLPIIVGVAAGFMLVVDRFSMIRFGTFSMGAAVTILVAGSLLALSPLVLGAGMPRVIPMPMTIFFAYSVMRLALQPSIDGVQNVAILLIVGLGVSFSARGWTHERAGLSVSVLAGCGIVISGLALVQAATGAVIYGTRSFALSALVALAAAIAVPSGRLLARVAPIVIVAAIVASLSRTASIIAVLLLAGLVVRLPRGRRTVLALGGLALAAGGAWTLITTFPPLRDRFLGGDQAAEFGGLAINTSGRSALWEALMDSAMTTPVFGQGPGSAAGLVEARFYPILLPHNEYIRLFHDLGIVGLALFAFGCIALIGRIAVRAARTDHPIHWAALLAMIAVLTAAATDNVFLYPFVMVPLAVLVGFSLGMPVTERMSIRRDK
ncbi:O-antigen ligase family protein [Leifsonia sp. Le1]|uniref:O-antigen ligase family protein n=1 Tax=Leifsonia sp. Le1 TaxID=3404918 RepID=UPI003EBB7D37